MTGDDTALSPAGYELVEQLGEGASGVVYKARQASTGQWVAVKFLRSSGGDAASRTRRAARFERETRLCAQLHHPHIVRLVDKGQDAGGCLYAVFEYVPGRTLHELLSAERALPAPVAGELMRQVLDALVEAHAQGIVHRDLKPLNIMVTGTGERLRAKVLDFGIGTFSADFKSPCAGDVTLSAETLGTPRYNAPEQLRGEPPTVKSDLYAWGLILLECLTGVPVVGGQTLAEIYHEHLSPHEFPLPAAVLGHPLGMLLRSVLGKQSRGRIDTDTLYARFRDLQLHGLVGTLAAADAIAGPTAATRVAAARVERRHVTMLGFALTVSAKAEGPPSEAAAEAMEELLRDQLALCEDACVAVGGYLAGSLGGTRLMYFGYPQASDSASRRAASAALDLVTRCAQRGQRLESRAAMHLEIRVVLHGGLLLARAGQVPGGMAAGFVERLLRQAPAGAVLVSDPARRLLERHVVFEALPGALAMEDGRAASTWRLCSERRAEFRADHAPLVGRAVETAALDGLWRRASAGEAAAVLLEGDAGLGKSRLTQAFCDRVVDDGGQVRVLQCLPEQRHSALHPFLAWIVAELGLSGASDPAARLRSELHRLDSGDDEVAVVLASWLGLPLPAGSAVQHAPQRQRSMVFAALRALLSALARRPTVLVVEDVHWADPTSREFIRALQADGGIPGLAWVLTTRPEGDFRPQVDRLPLEGLDAGQAEELLASLALGRRLSANERAGIVRRGDGNPLFLTELARACVETAPAGGEVPAVPTTLHAVLEQALDRLGPAKEAAQLAAAIGREFELALLSQAAALDDASIQSQLEQLMLADLVTRLRRAQGDVYVFRHSLVRDAAYASMPLPARTQAHERIAFALQGFDGASPVALARHFSAAGLFDLAVPHAVRAAGESMARAQYEEALGQIEALQPWLDSLPPDRRAPAALDVALLSTQALMARHGWADSRARDAAEYAHGLLAQVTTAVGESLFVRRASALWGLTTFHHVAGNRPRARELAEQLVALAGAHPEDPSLQRAGLAFQGMTRWIDGRYAEAAETLSRAAALQRAQGDADALRYGLDCRCWGQASLANVLWFQDDDRALAMVTAAVEEAEALGHVPTLGVCLMYQAFIHQYEENRSGAKAVCERMFGIAGRYGLPAVEAYAVMVHAWACDDAATLTATLARLLAMGCRLGTTRLHALAADLAWRGGNSTRAAHLLDTALELAERHGEPYYVAELLRRRAALMPVDAQGCPGPRAFDLLRSAHELAQRMGMVRTARLAAQQMQEPHRVHDAAASLDHSLLPIATAKEMT